MTIPRHNPNIRLLDAMRKMSPGTMGGQSVVATPAAPPKAVVPGTSPTSIVTTPPTTSGQFVAYHVGGDFLGATVWYLDWSLDTHIPDFGERTVDIWSDYTNVYIQSLDWETDITLTNIILRGLWSPSVAPGSVELYLRLWRYDPPALLWEDGPGVNSLGNFVELQVPAREPLVLDGQYAWQLAPFWTSAYPDPLAVSSSNTFISFVWECVP